MSTQKAPSKRPTRTRRRTKLNRIMAGDAPQKQKNIRTVRDPGAPPLKKNRDTTPAQAVKKKKKSGKVPYIIHDEYFHEAKRLGYRARSAFKLLEIQEKYDIVKPGMRVLDIASAPGSWLQVLARIVWPTGLVAGVDIQKIKPLGYPNVHVFQGDVFVTEPIIGFLKGLDIQKEEVSQKWWNLSWKSSTETRRTEDGTVSEDAVRRGGWTQSSHFSEAYKFDCLTSDIAPSTTGQTGVDQYRSVELNLAILDIADTFLKKWGTLVLKVFVGEDVNDLIGPVKARYSVLHRIKPKACRDRSFEEYFVCRGKKG